MIEQIAIALFGVTAVFLSQMNNRNLVRYSCLCDMASQPFWFYATYQAQQWGIFVLSFFYAGSWLFGFYNHWIKPRKAA